MPYKENCGFRVRVPVCKFRAEDCVPEKCSFHNLPFTSRDVRKRIDEEQKLIRELHNDTTKNEVEIRDRASGVLYLLRAWHYLKRCGK
jgi:hypothetical protein